jgi:DNA polymerase III epsilon subunit-like protein
VTRLFAAVDLETSGLDPAKHEIIEVGVVLELPRLGGALYDSIVVEQHTFSLPFDVARADAKALELNGWGTRPFPPERDPAWAAGFMSAVLADKYIVGKNPQFDVGFLAALLARYGLKPTWHHRLVDVGMLAWGYSSGVETYCMGQVWPQPPNSEKVAELVNVDWPENERHTALADAQWAYDVFRMVVSR